MYNNKKEKMQTTRYYTITPVTNATSTNPYEQTNTDLLNKSGIQSNWEYRRYLQTNGKEAMKCNAYQAMNDSGVNPYTLTNTQSSSNAPILYATSYDNRQPLGYQPSDLKEGYWTKFQMDARKIAPSISIKK